MALQGVWFGNVHDCVFSFCFFFVFCSEINFRQAPFSIVKATPHLLHCKDNFTFWPNDYELWVSIYVCVHVCVAFHFSWTFHSRLPQALSAETWLLLLSFFFFFFLGRGPPMSMLNQCNWACFLLRVEYGVQSKGCTVDMKTLHRIKCCFLNPIRRSVYD